MIRLRALLTRSPGLSAMAAMIALMAVAWGMPEIGAPSVATAQSVPLA